MIFNREPSRIIAAIQALLILAAGFGVEISTDQQGFILGAVAAVLSLVAGEATRSQVYAPATVEGLVGPTD